MMQLRQLVHRLYADDLVKLTAEYELFSDLERTVGRYSRLMYEDGADAALLVVRGNGKRVLRLDHPDVLDDLTLGDF